MNEKKITFVKFNCRQMRNLFEVEEKVVFGDIILWLVGWLGFMACQPLKVI